MSMTKIATVTVGSGGAASIDFTSIPGTMTDLYLVVSARTNRAADIAGLRLVFNSNTTGYTNRLLYGNGSAAYSNTDTNATAGDATAANNTSNTFGNSHIYIPNYAGSTNKSFGAEGVTENNGTFAGQFMSGALWSNTAAITSISIKAETDPTFLQYSTATLYGITKGSLAGVTVS